MRQLGFFNLEDRLESLSEAGDPLKRLDLCVNWNQFRPILEKSLVRESKTGAGRPRYDVVMMFKVLILQSLYNLSDEQLQYQITDRLSFMRFLDVGVEKKVPDQKTIWLFRDELTKAGIVTELFARFERELGKVGFRAQQGSIVDATIVEVPVRHSPPSSGGDSGTGEEEESLSASERQKDPDATWTKKNGKSFFGYKNHILIDAKHRFIRSYATSTAKTHESTLFEELIESTTLSGKMYGDSAYDNRRIKELLEEEGMENCIQRQARGTQELPKRVRKKNRSLAKIRCRVEHVFAFQAGTMKAKTMRCIGLIRAHTVIGLRNLTYNLLNLVRLRLRTA